MSKRFLLACLFIFAIITGGYYFTRENASGAAQPETVKAETGVTVGKAAPVFALNDLEGKKVEIGNAKKVYVINFWATWCPPCRAEMPELNQFAAKYKDTVSFYAVNLQEPPNKVKDFLTENNYKIPVLLDQDGSVGKNFRVSAIPTTIVVDANGIIVFRKSGGVTLSELEGIIKGL